jgi:hypothetical protein
MNLTRKILYSAALFLLVAGGTALQFLHFYNRTPWRIGMGIVLGIILYIALARALIWKKK